MMQGSGKGRKGRLAAEERALGRDPIRVALYTTYKGRGESVIHGGAADQPHHS